MCIRVDANGVGGATGTHISVGAYLMRGDNDDHLTWPFYGSVIVQLLNCQGDYRHFQWALEFTDVASKESAQRVMKGDRAVMGRIKSTFCSHTCLSCDHVSGTQYLTNDTLQFKVLHVNIYSRINKVPKWRHPSTPTTAVAEFTMSEFAKHSTAQDDWYSPKFYGHSYCFLLKVKASGFGSGKRSYVGVSIALARGVYDNGLSWPFHGAVTVQMLNWRADSEHKEGTISFCSVPSDANSRVTTGEHAEMSFGIAKFLPLTDLYYNPRTNTQFLDEDCIQLRVVSVTTH